VLDELEQIAPVRAVRGNVDHSPWTDELPISDVVDVGGFSFYVVHDYQNLDLNPKAAGFDAVISGHTHKALVEWRNGVLLLNPGSAGPRRFSLPITLAVIELDQGKLKPSIIQLEP
jgi:uncharacterized protein